MLIVCDSTDRENEGDLIVAASLVTSAQMAFIIRHTSGIVCVPLSSDRVRELDLQPMTSINTDAHGTAFLVSVDHWDAGTGVSAINRCKTAHALAYYSTKPCSLRRPGHVFPLQARDGGVRERPGHTEAAIDLCKLAGLPTAAVISEITRDDGEMAIRDDLFKFAVQHDLKIISIEALIAYLSSLKVIQ